jgi:ATP-binding cassette subfamily B protein
MGKLVGSFDPSLPEPPTPSFIWINFAIIMFLAFLGYLTNRAGRIRSAEVSTSALYHLRADISNAIYKQSFAYFDKHETGQLIARATSDVEQTQMIFGFGLATGLQAFVQLIGVIISGSLLEPRLSWIFYIAIPFSIIVTFVVISFLKPIFLETREAFGLLTNTIRENIIGASVVRIFSMQDKERKKFSENNKRFYDASVHSAKLSSLFMPFFVLTVGFMVILLLFVSGKFIINHEMELSTLVTFQSYIGLSIFPLVIFSQIMLFYVQANAAFVRIREVIESTPEIVDSPNAIPLPSHQIKGVLNLIMYLSDIPLLI